MDDVSAREPHPAPTSFTPGSDDVHASDSRGRRLRHTVEVTVVLVGPTAAGKSSLAAALVRRYAVEGRRAEVVNADSMLVYRGMDIGTAKPSEAERAEIRHHMVDLLEVSETATVAEFQQLARACDRRLPSSRRHPDRGRRIRPCTSEPLSTTSSSQEPIRRCERGWSTSSSLKVQSDSTSV